MHIGLCFCAELPTLVTRTRVVLFLHRLEERKSTNTGRLAASCLTNATIVVRGHEQAPTPPYVPEEGRRTLLLFPHDDAVPLDRLPPSDLPVTLLVPDGTWRQASKTRARVAGLSGLPCVSVPRGDPSRYRLRAETHEDGLSTLEAIARSLDALGEPGARGPLERVLRLLVERSLWSRGRLGAGDVTDGLPETAVRHDPRSGLGVTPSR